MTQHIRGHFWAVTAPNCAHKTTQTAARGVDLFQTFSGNTALHIVSSLSNHTTQAEAVKLLMRKGGDPGLRNLENELPYQLTPEGPVGEKVRASLQTDAGGITELLFADCNLKTPVFPAGATDPEGETCSCLSEAEEHCQSDSPVYENMICQRRQMLVVSVKHSELFITM